MSDVCAHLFPLGDDVCVLCGAERDDDDNDD